MNYWALEMTHTRNPGLGWVPYAVIRGGGIRRHLELTTSLPTLIGGIEEVRLRPLDVGEGQRLVNSGITLWKLGEDKCG
jgi:hypothetical protein